ncbi:MAG TPA: Ig-like domain repeat protein [Thermoanaerobaculia bacterium]
MNGWLEVVWSDAEAASDPAPPPLFLLTRDDGTTVTLAVDEEVLRRAGGVFAVNRRQVSLSGAWQNDASGAPRVFAVQAVTPRRTRGGEAEAAPGASQAWISILCKFSDSASEPRPLGYFQNMYADSYPGLGHYWREQSYDKVDITGSSAAGWFVLPQPRSYYVYDMNLDGVVDFDLVSATEDCTAAADPSVHFPSYAGINMMFNEPLDCCARGSGFFLTRDGVSKTWMTTWLPPWAYIKLALTSHEMGHGYGFPHSSGMYGATYDNKWDVMSAPSTGCELATDPTYGCLGQHTISYHKSKAGWIPPDRQYVLDGQMATVELEQTALPQTAGYRMAHIPIPGTSRFYTVEVRRHAGYDSKLTGQGVIIHEVEEGRVSPARVVDVDGNGDTGDAGAIWTVGEVFQDNVNGVSIGVASATATGFVVTLSVNAAIEMTLTSSMNPSLPGAQVTFTASVGDGATGNVTFKEDGSILGTVALSGGIATFSKSYASAGSHVISAQYAGDLGSSSTQLTQTIVTQAVTIGDVAVVEGNGGTANAVFTVSMSTASAQTVTVGYGTANGTATGGQTFPGGSAIAIPTSGNGSPYPSAIAVAGLSGTIAKVTVGIQGLSHEWPGDVDILLVGPAGQTVFLLSDAGSSTGISDVTLTFDDAAATSLNYFNVSSGTYTPTNYPDGEGADFFGAPAPAAPYGTQLSALNGASPNGTWKLFVVDDVAGSAGSIAGWSLTIATTGGDYFPASGFLTFPPGVVSQTISVPVIGDTALEPDETFFVNLVQAWNAVIVDAQGQGTIGNDDATVAAPANVVASAAGTASVNVTWSAVPGVDLYRVYRSANNSLYTLVGSSETPAFTDGSVSPNTAYLYRVRSVAAEESADSNSDLATTVAFTDPVLSGTRVKSLHFTELLEAVNAVRALAGQASMAFTAPAPAASVRIKRQHILDLRNGLSAARAALTLSAVSYVDPAIAAGTTAIKSAHVADLRNGVQ